MAFSVYTRLRLNWGGVDFQFGTDYPYSDAQTFSGGTSVVSEPSIGVRRAEVVIDRATTHAGADVATMHWDWLNITSGAPDDTWTSGDFSTLEGYLQTFYSTLSVLWHTGYKVTQVSWYRVGVGAPKPNPAVRVYTPGTPWAGTGTSVKLPPQAAASITFRTPVRRSWGRTYMPLVTEQLSTPQALSTSTVDMIAGAANSLFTSSAAADFMPVVYSKHLSTALAVEHVECDDVVDIIRRRRWKASTYKKIIP